MRIKKIFQKSWGAIFSLVLVFQILLPGAIISKVFADNFNTNKGLLSQKSSEERPVWAKVEGETNSYYFKNPINGNYKLPIEEGGSLEIKNVSEEAVVYFRKEFLNLDDQKRLNSLYSFGFELEIKNSQEKFIYDLSLPCNKSENEGPIDIMYSYDGIKYYKSEREQVLENKIIIPELEGTSSVNGTSQIFVVSQNKTTKSEKNNVKNLKKYKDKKDTINKKSIVSLPVEIKVPAVPTVSDYPDFDLYEGQMIPDFNFQIESSNGIKNFFLNISYEEQNIFDSYLKIPLVLGPGSHNYVFDSTYLGIFQKVYTKIYKEGHYVLSYYVQDLDNQNSIIQRTNINVYNISPTINGINPTRNVLEGQLADFYIDFNDPSYQSEFDRDSLSYEETLLFFNNTFGTNYSEVQMNDFLYELGLGNILDLQKIVNDLFVPDDAPWIIKVDYGDGYKITFPVDKPGRVHFNHSYAESGNYSVKIQVCEYKYPNGNINSEGTCSNIFQTATKVSDLKPKVVVNPINSSIYLDESILINSEVYGNGPFLYNWYCDGILVSNNQENFLYKGENLGQHSCYLQVKDKDGDLSDKVFFNVNVLENKQMKIIYGCTDTRATNFNSEANKNDGSCLYPGEELNIILGCMDRESLNYNPQANQDNGTCVYGEKDTDQDKGQIKGENDKEENQKEEEICKDENFWWWLPLIPQFIITIGFAMSIKKQRLDEPERKLWLLFPIIIGIVSQYIHSLYDCNCATSDFCDWYWLFNLMIIIIGMIYFYDKITVDETEDNN